MVGAAPGIAVSPPISPPANPTAAAAPAGRPLLKIRKCRTNEHVAGISGDEHTKADAQRPGIHVMQQIHRGRDPRSPSGEKRQARAPIHATAQRYQSDELNRNAARHHQRHRLMRRQQMHQNDSGDGGKCEAGRILRRPHRQNCARQRQIKQIIVHCGALDCMLQVLARLVSQRPHALWNRERFAGFRVHIAARIAKITTIAVGHLGEFRAAAASS